MGQIVSSAAKPKRCNANQLSQVPTPAAGEHILVSSDNSMNAVGQGNFDCYIVGDGTRAASALPLHRILDEDVQQLLGFFKESETIDITEVYDGILADSYIAASNATIYSSNGQNLYYRLFENETTIQYSVSGSYVAIGYRNTPPVNRGTVTLIASSGTGTAVVPAGKYLVWSKASTVKIYTTLESMSEPLLVKDLADNVEEGSDAPVKGGGIYQAIQAASGADTKKSIFTDIVPDGTLDGYYIASSNAKIYAQSGFAINYKHIEEDTTFAFNVQHGTESVASSNSVPSSGLQTTLIATSGNSGEATVVAGKYLLWCVYKSNPSCFVKTSSEVFKSLIDGETLVKQENTRQKKETRSTVMLDGSICVGWFRNGSPNIMDVVSATSDSITISSEDASELITDSLIAVKHSDGTYSCHLFSLSSSTLTIQRRIGYDDNADLSNAVKIQGVYDTPNSGMGQHLSAFGYLAYANYIAQAIHARCSIKQDNLVYGLFFGEQGQNSTSPYFQSGLLYDGNMNVIAVPSYENAKFTGTLSGNISAHAGVLQGNYYQDIKSEVIKYYTFVQNVQGASVEFDLPSDGYIGKGYVEIIAGKVINENFTGGVQVEVKENGIVKSTTSLNNVEGKIVCDGLDLTKRLSVKFSLLDNALTNLIITSIRLYQAAEGKTAVPTIKTTDKVAIIGDSWTQFPPASGVVESDNTYNTIDTLANGQQAGGYCYLPKELSRLLGVEIDNYGKSNMTASYGIEQMADIIKSGKHYDYIILEYYINDRTASTDANIWLSKMAQLVAMCKSINAKPIILGPTSTNSINQSVGLISWWHQLAKGLNL